MFSSTLNNAFILSLGISLTLPALGLAQTPDFDKVLTPALNEPIQAGSEFTITWKAPEQYWDQYIKIALISGPSSQSLEPVQDIAYGVRNADETYVWNVDPDLGDDVVYGLMFSVEANPEIYQYSTPFKITPQDPIVETPALKSTCADCFKKEHNLAKFPTHTSPLNLTRGGVNETFFRLGNGTTFRGKPQFPKLEDVTVPSQTAMDKFSPEATKAIGAGNMRIASSMSVVIGVLFSMFAI